MRSFILLVFLVLILPLYIPAVPVHASPARLGRSFGIESAQVLTVWFDAAPQLTIAYPPAYLFNVAAKTANGLWITSLHWDFGDGATLDVPFSAQSQVSDIRAHQYATQANYCVTVTAYDSAGNTAVVSISLMTNYDFTLAATPVTENVIPGGSTSYNVAVGSSLACSNPVPVSLIVSSPPPQGVTWNLNPASGQAPFTSTLQVQTSTTTPNGTYSISVVGSSSKFAHTATVTLIVLTPSFTLTVNPSSIAVPSQPDTQPGQTNTTTATVQSLNGFNNAVALTASGVPNGMSLTFSLPSITPPPNGQATSLITIVTPCSVTPGSYAITVQGNGGGIVRQAVFNVSVSACSATFNIIPYIIAGIVGLLLLIPLLFFFTRPGPAVAVVPPAPFGVPLAPQAVPCPICGNPLSPVDGKWYCATCHRRTWIAP